MRYVQPPTRVPSRIDVMTRCFMVVPMVVSEDREAQSPLLLNTNDPPPDMLPLMSLLNSLVEPVNVWPSNRLPVELNVIVRDGGSYVPVPEMLSDLTSTSLRVATYELLGPN